MKSANVWIINKPWSIKRLNHAEIFNPRKTGWDFVQTISCPIPRVLYIKKSGVFMKMYYFDTQ